MAAGRGDAFLERAHLVGEVRLVTHSGRHTAKQRGHLGTGLGEAEDVVDEQQHVLVLHITEVLRHGQCGQRDTQTRPRRLIHLAEDQRGLAEHACLRHFADQVVAFTGTLANAGEHGHAAVVLRHALDHFLDQHRLADACAAEQADLAALHVRSQQVDDLDAGFEHLGLGLQLVECRRIAVDWPAFLDRDGLVGLLVEDIARDIEHMPLGDVTDRDLNRAAGIGHLSAAHQAVSRLERNGTHGGVAKVLLHFHGDLVKCLTLRVAHIVELHGQGVVDVGQVAYRELDVDDGTLDARHASDVHRFDVGFGSRCGLVLSHMRSYSSSLFSASALPMISVSSWVIDAWREALSLRVSSSTRLRALSVAVCMAFWRDAVSDAAEVSRHS